MDPVLSSTRLLVMPLTLTQLKLQVSDPAGFVTALGFPSRLPDTAPSDLLDALSRMANSIETAPESWPWNTNWAIIHRQDQAYIGGIDLHGAPDVDGQVEIGYGLDEACRHHGLMTEALQLMLGWAFSHPEVRVVKAETALTNLASQRVLQRAGFCPYLLRADNLWWRLERPFRSV